MWREGKYIRSFGGETKEREQLEDQGLDGNIILKGTINRTGRRGLDLCGSGRYLVAD